jgi:hypothetical protein
VSGSPSRRSPAPASSGSASWTAIGAFLFEAIPLGVLGLLLAALTDGLGVVFQLAFVAVAVVGAFKVRRSDLLAAFIVPPLAYAGALVIASPALGITNGLLVGIGANLGSYLAVGAPWLFLGTVLAFAVAVWRGRTGR